MPCALGVDVGTTNLKVALVRDDTTLVASTERPLTVEHGPGTAEQDAGAVWTQLVDAVRELTTAQPDAAAAVVAMAVCSQYSSIVPVDAGGEPVAPMLMWQDHRGTDHSYEIMRRDKDAFRIFTERHGIPPIGSGLSLGHILSFQLDRPDVHAATTAYLEAMDYVTARLTGRITASQHTSFMVQLCDNRSLGATTYDDDLVRLAGIDPTRLPPLIPVDAAVGTLLPAVATALGLPAAVIVYAAANDTAADAIATGAFTPGRAGLAIGTTSVIVDGVADFRTDLEHQILSMPGPYVDRYVVCAENGLGGKVLEHVLEHVVYANDALGDHRVADPFGALDDILRTTAPALGAMFLPWLSGSLAPMPSGAIRGGFINLSLQTDRAGLVRAVVEGIAHNLAWLLPHVEAFSGESIDEIGFVGGAARSEPWCQLLADVLGRPVAPLASPGTAVASAMALLALERHGVLSSADLERAATMTRTGRFLPDPALHERYAYRQVQFEAAYAALLPISEALS